MIYPPIKTAITTAAFVPVRLQPGGHCDSFSLWTEDKADYYISSLADGSDGILMPSGFPMGIIQKENKSKDGQIICYAKGTSSTNLVGLIIR